MTSLFPARRTTALSNGLPILLLTLALFAFCAPALAQGPRIVASTSWAAAYARAAGATDVRTVCPVGVVHPPDYDPRPSDLALVANADFLVLGGFEGFATRMAESADAKARIVKVKLLNTPDNIHAEILRLGELFGTLPAAQRFLARFDGEIVPLRDDLRATLAARRCVIVAQAFVAHWAGFAGYPAVGTYGPGMLKPTDLPRLAALKPTLVMDNGHMPCGEPVAESCHAALVRMINFPGEGMDILDVFRENARRLGRAAVSLPPKP